ncbi:MAG: type II toxin-antitoxin system VapC family toxin [Acidobacteria bacterium]|nr:type II toxin-antitoxin system VapC family toxin [Acidobacteriota bacterium]
MILIDTTPLVALCDARDEKHRVAVKHLDSLIPNEFAVCEAVLTEACFHLAEKSQRQRLHALIDDLRVQPVAIAYERTFWLDVFEWLTKYADQQPDWADGCLAVLSERLRNAKVWTYDREFRTTWRRPNGTIIPLAVRSA